MDERATKNILLLLNDQEEKKGIEKVKDLINCEQFEAAIQECDLVLGEKGKDYEYMLHRTIACVRLGKGSSQRASQLINQMESTHCKCSSEAKFIEAKLIHLLREGKNEQIEKYVNILSDLLGNQNENVLRYQVEHLLKQSRFNEADQILEFSLKRFPYNPTLYELRGDLQLHIMNNQNLSLEIYRYATQMNKRNASLYAKVATILYNKSFHSEAALHSSVAIEQLRQNGDLVLHEQCLFLRGNSLIFLKEYEDGQADFQKILDKNERILTARIGKLKACLLRGINDQAIAIIKKGEELHGPEEKIFIIGSLSQLPSSSVVELQRSNRNQQTSEKVEFYEWMALAYFMRKFFDNCEIQLKKKIKKLENGQKLRPLIALLNYVNYFLLDEGHSKSCMEKAKNDIELESLNLRKSEVLIITNLEQLEDQRKNLVEYFQKVFLYLFTGLYKWYPLDIHELLSKHELAFKESNILKQALAFSCIVINEGKKKYKASILSFINQEHEGESNNNNNNNQIEREGQQQKEQSLGKINEVKEAEKTEDPKLQQNNNSKESQKAKDVPSLLKNEQNKKQDIPLKQIFDDSKNKNNVPVSQQESKETVSNKKENTEVKKESIPKIQECDIKSKIGGQKVESTVEQKSTLPLQEIQIVQKQNEKQPKQDQKNTYLDSLLNFTGTENNEETLINNSNSNNNSKQQKDQEQKMKEKQLSKELNVEQKQEIKEQEQVITINMASQNDKKDKYQVSGGGKNSVLDSKQKESSKSQPISIQKQEIKEQKNIEIEEQKNMESQEQSKIEEDKVENRKIVSEQKNSKFQDQLKVSKQESKENNVQNTPQEQKNNKEMPSQRKDEIIPEQSQEVKTNKSEQREGLTNGITNSIASSKITASQQLKEQQNVIEQQTKEENRRNQPLSKEPTQIISKQESQGNKSICVSEQKNHSDEEQKINSNREQAKLEGQNHVQSSYTTQKESQVFSNKNDDSLTTTAKNIHSPTIVSNSSCFCDIF